MRFISFSLICVILMSLICDISFFSCLLAGWIGNDAISAVIGESDPYYTVNGRVSVTSNGEIFRN